MHRPVAGLALWTSLKVVVVLGPILLLLLVWDRSCRCGGRAPRGSRASRRQPAGVALLSDPAGSGAGNLGSARRFLDVGLDLSWPRLSRFVIEVPPLVIGTYYFDPKTWLRIAALILALGIYLAAIVCVGVRTFSARREAPPSRTWGVWLLLLTLVATFAALYFSEFSQVGAHARARYVLPAYIALFVFLGEALAALARRSRDGVAGPAPRGVGGDAARRGHDPRRGAPRPVAHGADRRPRASGGRGVDGRDHV